MPPRQTTGFVESLLRLVGLNWRAPDFSTLCRRQTTLNVVRLYRGGSGPLTLLIGSSGIKSEGETPETPETPETHEPRCHCAKRDSQYFDVPGPFPVATEERISPPEPC